MSRDQYSSVPDKEDLDLEKAVKAVPLRDEHSVPHHHSRKILFVTLTVGLIVSLFHICGGEHHLESEKGSKMMSSVWREGVNTYHGGWFDEDDDDDDDDGDDSYESGDDFNDNDMFHHHRHGKKQGPHHHHGKRHGRHGHGPHHGHHHHSHGPHRPRAVDDTDASESQSLSSGKETNENVSIDVLKGRHEGANAPRGHRGGWFDEDDDDHDDDDDGDVGDGDSSDNGMFHHHRHGKKHGRPHHHGKRQRRHGHHHQSHGPHLPRTVDNIGESESQSLTSGKGTNESVNIDKSEDITNDNHVEIGGRD